MNLLLRLRSAWHIYSRSHATAPYDLKVPRRAPPGGSPPYHSAALNKYDITQVSRHTEDYVMFIPRR